MVHMRLHAEAMIDCLGVARTPDKRDRILTGAALSLGRYGYKRASMDAIAREAGVAKATLYAYFSDKEALFIAVVENVTGRFVDAATVAAQSDGPIASRIEGILAAKFQDLFELVHSSPHAAELIASKDALGGKTVERADRRYLQVLSGALRDAQSAGELDLARTAQAPNSAAQFLIRSAHGAKVGCRSAAAHRRNLAELARVFVASATS